MRAPRRVARLCACALAALLLAACDDGSELERAAAEADAKSARKAVSPEEATRRQGVIGSVSYLGPAMASHAMAMYDAQDAGPGSEAMKNAGGEAFVAAEVRAIELYHLLYPLDRCMNDTFALKTPEGARRFIEALSSAPQGKQIVDFANDTDAESFAYSLDAMANVPPRYRRVAAAFETLGVAYRTSPGKRADKALTLLAKTLVLVAPVSKGACAPSPELLAAMEAVK